MIYFFLVIIRGLQPAFSPCFLKRVCLACQAEKLGAARLLSCLSSIGL